MLRTFACLVGVIALAGIAGCGGPSEEQREAAAKARADATKTEKKANEARLLARDCRGQMGDLNRSLNDLGGRLDVGMNFEDYSSEVGDISVIYNRIPFGKIELECLTVGVKGEAAFQHFSKAYDIWNECISDLYCENDSIEPELQAQWLKADRKLRQAKSDLAALNQDAQSAEETATEKAKAADKSEAALE